MIEYRPYGLFSIFIVRKEYKDLKIVYSIYRLFLL
jgi:hypothetical protein